MVELNFNPPRSHQRLLRRWVHFLSMFITCCFCISCIRIFVFNHVRAHHLH
jgi:hypothetical protein